MANRNENGRFSFNKRRNRPHILAKTVKKDHPYILTNVGSDCTESKPWLEGRRLVEWEVLLTNLRACQKCRLGSLPFMLNSVQGEFQKCLSGYLYVKCGSSKCGKVNRVAYGKTHRLLGKSNGMTCFDINTKLGISEYRLLIKMFEL